MLHFSNTLEILKEKPLLMIRLEVTIMPALFVTGAVQELRKGEMIQRAYQD